MATLKQIKERDRKAYVEEFKKKPLLQKVGTLATAPFKEIRSKEQQRMASDFSAKNRANLAQGVKDVVTGRAAWEGAKAVGRWATQNVSRTEERHKRITGYKGK